MSRGMEQSIRSCTRCIYNDAVDPDLFYNSDGLCNHCVQYDRNMAALVELRQPMHLEHLLDKIRKAGKGKKYDCVIGVSGGGDSSYVAHLVKQFGLRPLAVHCDNGWNTELAVTNIHSLVSKLGIDLYTHVINWEVFRDLQLSYLKASVVDIEVPSDHAIAAVMYKAAATHGIRHIISGENMVTEGLLPESWVYLKNDLVNLRAIHKRFGTRPLATFPEMGFARQWFYNRVRGISVQKLLDYVPYVKDDARRVLFDHYGWRDYGGKHHESIITRFYQSYILPQKFGIDKRYSHLSTLICSGQLSRESALAEIQQPPSTAEQIAADKRFVAKKFGLTEEAFDALMQLPIKRHSDYPSLPVRMERFRPLIDGYKKVRGLPLTLPVQRPHSVAMLIDNTYERDRRVELEAIALAKKYDVHLYAMMGPQLPSFEVSHGVKVHRVFEPDIHRLANRGMLRRHAREIAIKGYAAVHAHDYLMLDLAQRIKAKVPSTRVVYDSHELFHAWPLNLPNTSRYVHFKARVVRRTQSWLERRHARVADELVTVNVSLARILKPYFGFPKQPLVIFNTPSTQAVSRGRHLLRSHFNIPAEQRILVFIGMHAFPKTRNLEMVMDQVGSKDGIAFVIVSKADHHRAVLEAYARERGYSNIHFHDLVKPTEMVDYLCDCDAGLVATWNKKDLSYWYALDTKLFNYTMAELPVLITAQPEYKLFIEQYRTGVCVNPDEPDAFYAGFEELMRDRELYVANTRAAKLQLNWENESQKLLQLYDTLLPQAREPQRNSSKAVV